VNTLYQENPYLVGNILRLVRNFESVGDEDADASFITSKLNALENYYMALGLLFSLKYDERGPEHKQLRKRITNKIYIVEQFLRDLAISSERYRLDAQRLAMKYESPIKRGATRFDLIEPLYQQNPEFVYDLHRIRLQPASTHIIRKFEQHDKTILTWYPMYEQEWANQYKTFMIRAGQTILALAAISAHQPALDETGNKYLLLERLERHPEAPKVPGAGIIALMKLIQLSKEYGLHGALMLTALPSAAPFYRKIGMKQIGEENMGEEKYPVFIFNQYAAQDFLMWARKYLVEEKKVARNPDLLYADFTATTLT
jgi:hypothetical protein